MLQKCYHGIQTRFVSDWMNECYCHVVYVIVLGLLLKVSESLVVRRKDNALEVSSSVL